jgi:molecular chaperone Hsp33
LDLRVLVVCCTGPARTIAGKHGAAPAAAGVLGQGTAAGLLLAGLSKSEARLNLQMECDGPLHGMFVDADTDGNVRGYVKNPAADVQVASREFRFRPVLGNSGFLSVLRDLGNGEYYRSSVELQAMELGADVERYLEQSDQVESVLRLEVQEEGGEVLGRVAGLLLQPLPNGDRAALARFREVLGPGGGFARAVAENGSAGAQALLRRLFPGEALEFTARYPVQFRCRCSRERVLNALAALGKADLQSLLEEQGKATVTCDFCSTTYEVDREGMEALMARLEDAET